MSSKRPFSRLFSTLIEGIRKEPYMKDMLAHSALLPVVMVGTDVYFSMQPSSIPLSAKAIIAVTTLCSFKPLIISLMDTYRLGREGNGDGNGINRQSPRPKPHTPTGGKNLQDELGALFTHYPLEPLSVQRVSAANTRQLVNA